MVQPAKDGPHFDAPSALNDPGLVRTGPQSFNLEFASFYVETVGAAVVVGERVMNPRDGYCYPFALMAIINGEPGTLVHGTVDGYGPHAWIEHGEIVHDVDDGVIPYVRNYFVTADPAGEHRFGERDPPLACGSKRLVFRAWREPPGSALALPTART